MTTQMNVTIAGRVYPLRVQKEEEKEVIEVAELINQRVLEYKTKYEGRDAQDYLAMVLMGIAAEWFTLKQKGDKSLDVLKHKINELDLILSS